MKEWTVSITGHNTMYTPPKKELNHYTMAKLTYSRVVCDTKDTKFSERLLLYTPTKHRCRIFNQNKQKVLDLVERFFSTKYNNDSGHSCGNGNQWLHYCYAFGVQRALNNHRQLADVLPRTHQWCCCASANSTKPCSNQLTCLLPFLHHCVLGYEAAH